MRLSWLCSWFGGRSSRLEHLQVVLYTRAGCHLCEVAWQRLHRQQQRYHFALEVVNVDADPELIKQYGSQVPVVAVNGKVRFRGVINEVLLTRLLRAEARSQSARGV